MAKYLTQLRRGWKETDDDGKITRNDWEQYKIKPNYLIPQPGELVLEYDNGIPRLKIGDGVREFSELPYMSVDSFILPKPLYVNIKGGDSNWTKKSVVDDSGNIVTSAYFNGKTIDVKGIVDYYDGSYQIKVFSLKDITIH